MQKFKTLALATFIAVTVGSFAFAAEPVVKAKLVDINEATEAQLKAIPGVGDEYAKKIIVGRPYNNKGELKAKKIIPTDLYEKINKLIMAVC